MANVINTIIPVFAIILLGSILRWRRFIPPSLIAPLNRLVYYLAIPAMIFSGVAGSSFVANFDPLLLASILIPPLLIFLMALVAGILSSLDRQHIGTFMQCSMHGNLGYIGLAVCYYLLGEKGLTSASILAGFLILCQNFLSVLGYQMYAGQRGRGSRLWFFIRKIGGNPVIWSALAGMTFSLFKIPIPEIVDRGLKIISGMALPSALLVIGASLSFSLMRANIRLVLASAVFKLGVLPAIGIAGFHLAGIEPARFLPGLILLATPTATITYVMAGEMGGSTDLASAAISTNTLLSALTFILWLWQFS